MPRSYQLSIKDIRVKLMKTLGTSDIKDIDRSIMNHVVVRRAKLVITMAFCSLPLLAASQRHPADLDAIAAAKDAHVAICSWQQDGHAHSDRIIATASAIWGTKAIRGTSAISGKAASRDQNSAISEMSPVSGASTPEAFVVIWGHAIRVANIHRGRGIPIAVGREL